MTATLLLLTLFAANPAPPQGPPVRDAKRSAYMDVLELVDSGREVTVYVGIDPPKGKGIRARLESFDGHRSGVFRCWRENGEAKYLRIDATLPPEKKARPYTDPVGWHRHKCESASCGFIWSHPDGTASAGHYCPGCGRYENDKYKGTAPPTTTTPSATPKPKRLNIGGKWYDQYPDGRLVECAT